MLRMLAWVAAGFIVLIAAGILALLLFRSELTAFYLNPGVPFEDSPAPAAPDYETPAAWAAKPGRADTADLVPPGMAPAVSDAAARVDVFFIHPTTYYSSARWNGPIDDATARDLVDAAVMPMQAGSFNMAGRIYAPYYRQATLYAFLEPWDDAPSDSDGAKALELAYSDVARAFETYIRLFNNGRPFILAAHSQGSLHLLRLLQDYIRAPELRTRLVAAYVIGMSVPESLFQGPAAPVRHVPPCTTPDQTGCLLSWNTFGPDGDPRLWFERQRIWENGVLTPVAGRPLNCSNPLAWTQVPRQGADTPSNRAIPFRDRSQGMPITALPDPVSAEFKAVCRNGILFLDRTPPDGLHERVVANGDYHFYDYNLFYGALRENAALRANAYLAMR